MARIKDPNVAAAAFAPYLEPGEQLRHVAFGVKQPNLLLILPLFALAVLPGAIAVALLTKEYVIGLTDRRLIVLRFKGKNVSVQEVLDYRLNNGHRPPVKASTGGLFTHIKIEDPAKPFVAKFHRMGMPKNRENSMAIADVLSKKALPAKAA